MGKQNNKITYIPQIEAALLWENEHRGKQIQFKYKGSLPDSLMVRHLKKQDNYIQFTTGRTKKNSTRDIIAIKFTQKVKSGKQLIKIANDKLDELEKEKNETGVCDEESKSYWENKKKEIESDIENPKWRGFNSKQLREEIYKHGVTVIETDYKTGEILSKDTFKFFCRTTSKSRKGECLMIKESLRDDMLKWMMLELDFSKKTGSVDLSGIQSYLSLICSAIEGTVKINPSSILMIDKVMSIFEHEVDVIELEENTIVTPKGKEIKESKLIRTPRKATIENEIFDGELLLDESCFKGDYAKKGFMLLRGFWFKGAAFNTRLQDMLRAYAIEKGIDFDTWYIEDMFGDSIKASKIRMIANPSTLKLIGKYDYTLGSKKAVWERWKEKTKANGSIFGICKAEKISRRGEDKGFPLQRMSYQMVNSLPLIPKTTKEEIKKLAQYELNYISALKNDTKKFIEYLDFTKTTVNANEMFVSLYNRNNKIAENKVFRDFKAYKIKEYRKQVQSGGIRVCGDYAIMASNLAEYFLVSVGEIKLNDKREIEKPLALKGNEIITTMFPPGELAGFRNPHVSPANSILFNSVSIDEESNEYHKYLKYFKLTKNIVLINSISHILMDQLNGCDFDSDSCLLTDNEVIRKSIRDNLGKYKVPVNRIPLMENSKETEYQFTPEDMALVDSKNALATTEIGEITNQGILSLSLYFNELSKDSPNQETLDYLTDVFQICSVLSGIAIDSSKRQYKVKASQQLRELTKGLALKLDDNGEEAKPNFWVYVQNDKYKKKDVSNIEAEKDQTKESDGEKQKKDGLVRTHYNTPMDYLYDEFSNLTPAPKTIKPKKLGWLLIDKDVRKGNRRQIKEVQEVAEETQNLINATHAYSDEDELSVILDNIIDEQHDKFDKIKVNSNTMYAILMKIHEKTELKSNGETKEKNNSCVRLMSHLYKSSPNVFLEAFKLGKNEN
ncbi:hypothetical protein [Bacillus sp. Au-Bac7]|uniref:hypothetical protein n=1 Tax=Bacillus sp. Au-Bac7 TaxID=2906458 RepID=UPI001E2E046A|nr:hypothetical protein [Bacillus sp. Au-Bac7]MCE4051894.1 hypothetical protein [Bacillus sp. Au-Bac7]